MYLILGFRLVNCFLHLGYSLSANFTCLQQAFDILLPRLVSFVFSNFKPLFIQFLFYGVYEKLKLTFR